MTIATMMATPSTQSTGGSSLARGVPKSWKKPSASETTAATDKRIYKRPNDGNPRISRRADKTGIANQTRTKTLSLSASHIKSSKLFFLHPRIFFIFFFIFFIIV